MTPETHCTYCGAAHADPGWPKRCPACSKMTWKNPTPVAVVLLPVRAEGDLLKGLVAIRRGVAPREGRLALPGGYVDWEESWQQAGAREVREETGYELDPARLKTFDVQSPPDGRTVLIFGLAEPIDERDLPPFEGTSETTERVVITEPTEMAFPLHTAAVEALFHSVRGARWT